MDVDVDYPETLHDRHNELPFLPERMMIGKVEKLVPNFKDKCRYVVHIRALHKAINHGLILKEICQIIQFIQSNWLNPFIDLNEG